MPPINLGVLLPIKDRIDLAKSHLQPGSVFKFYCYNAKKEKIFILAGFKYDQTKIGFVHINTEINPNIFRTPALKNEHLPFELNLERPFLTHDSFVNCSDLIIRDKEDILKLLINDPAIHLGNLCESDMKEVHNKICSSKVLRRDYKKEFGISFLK